MVRRASEWNRSSASQGRRNPSVQIGYPMEGNAAFLRLAKVFEVGMSEIEE